MKAILSAVLVRSAGLLVLIFVLVKERVYYI